MALYYLDFLPTFLTFLHFFPLHFDLSFLSLLSKEDNLWVSELSSYKFFQLSYLFLWKTDTSTLAWLPSWDSVHPAACLASQPGCLLAADTHYISKADHLLFPPAKHLLFLVMSLGLWRMPSFSYHLLTLLLQHLWIRLWWCPWTCSFLSPCLFHSSYSYSQHPQSHALTLAVASDGHSDPDLVLVH